MWSYWQRWRALKNSSLWHHLQVTGLPGSCCLFVKLFVDPLQNGSFTDPPEVSRAHRILIAKLAEVETQSHYCALSAFQNRTEGAGRLGYQGRKIFIILNPSGALFNPVETVHRNRNNNEHCVIVTGTLARRQFPRSPQNIGTILRYNLNISKSDFYRPSICWLETLHGLILCSPFPQQHLNIQKSTFIKTYRYHLTITAPDSLMSW